MKTLYTAHAKSVFGRDGNVETDDNQLSAKLSRPGSNKPGTNPEQLFACGYSACFGSAVEFAAKQEGITLDNLVVLAEVNLNQDSNGFNLSIQLNVQLADLNEDVASKLVKKAHTVCPYSKAISNNVEVKLMANNQEIK